MDKKTLETAGLHEGYALCAVFANSIKKTCEPTQPMKE